jgi:NAD(P)-dependent dehydrogenase (short-subunit alcohol dehydrogenase family)
MMFQLNGKTAMVTGAGSGIGKAVAFTLSRQGAQVLILDVDKEVAGQVATEIRFRICP